MRRASWRLTAVCLTAFLGSLASAAPTASPAASSEDEKLLRAAKIGVDGPGLLEFFRQHTTAPAQQEQMLALIQRRVV